MPAHARRRRSTIVVLALLLAWPTPLPASAAQRTWIGGNVDWVDGGAATNWNPNDEPDADDEAIFNTANTVNLSSNNATNGLTLSGGIDLFTNEFDLTVDGLVQLTGAGTNLFIGEAAGSVDADDVTINADGTVELRGGTLTMNEEVGASLIDVNVGGNLIGNGTIMFEDTPGVLTTVLVNDGELTALSRGLTILSPPPVGALHINPAVGTFTRVDLDGAGETGVVNVNRNQTLDLNIGFADAFNGTMNLFQESHFDSINAWTLAGGSLIVNNGFVDNPLPTPDVPAGTSYIEGGLLTQTGGTINVVDTDGTLQLDVNFTMVGGSFTNSGTVIFNETTNITTAAGYAPATATSHTIVDGATTISDVAGDFNWDGPGAAETTVRGGGLLTINVKRVDTTDDVFGGTINLEDNGDLSVNVAAASWTMAGTLNKSGASGGTVTGDAVIVTGDVIANDGTLALPAATLSAGSNVTVNSRLILGAASTFAGPATLTGVGELFMAGTSTVSANTTVNVATFDWDGFGTGTSHTVNTGITFTINSGILDSDGDMDDPLTLAGAASQLIVNNTNGLTQWTVTGTVTANASGAGTATIGGTSRMIVAGLMNVDGNTNISAPVTFNRAGLVAGIDAGMTLDLTNSATYVDGTIDGVGTFEPGTSNTVTGDFTINPDNFNFDAGSWTIENGAELTLNVIDYEPAAVTNSFENTITLNRGSIFANTSDPTFVMNGTLNMNSAGGVGAEWDGDAINLGNDGGALDANLNVTGDGNANSQARFLSAVNFKSDADVDVPVGAFLNLVGVVNFDTVNAANNAEFTGGGTMAFNNVVNVNEAVTLNMLGGSVDLDGNDATGEFVNVDAPLTINAATFSNFGRVNGGGGTNTLDVNNNFGSGVLTVNLDDPNGKWTLNGPGVMNLVNDNTDATLLAGSDVNVNGTLNVTGDVRTAARLDIAGTVNVNTAAEPLRLAGGDNVNDPNTLAGGTISGVGVIGADAGKELRGFGTINSTIDFDGSAKLRADNGTLTINGAIVDADAVGTADADGTFHVTNAWNNNVTAGVQLNGGVVSGGAITNDVAAGISGHGLVTARTVNNTQLSATGGTLVVQTGANDNDWDGAGAGQLRAIGGGSVLEIRDTATFAFSGNVTANAGGRVYANGFGLNFQPASTINLTAATLQTDESTDIGGTVTVGVGSPSTIQVQNNRFLTIETGSTTTLNGDLHLANNNINIEAGAAFSGPGALVILDGSHMIADNLANIGVLLDMRGTFRPGGFNTIGRVDLFDYQQADTGLLEVELTGTALNAFDRLVASGDVALDGSLNIDIDGAFVPALGNTFNIITGNTVTGTFDTIDVSGVPAGLAFHLNYLSNAVQLQVVNKPIYTADFDDDGDVDSTDLAIWKNAFNLNQLGDANGDNKSDGSDFLLWQQQYGSAPAVAVVQPAAAAVPEPSTAVLLLAAMALVGCRRTRRQLAA